MLKVSPLLYLQCLHSISSGQVVLWQPEALLEKKEAKGGSINDSVT